MSEVKKTIKIRKKQKLNGDRGYSIEGSILRHRFTASCGDGEWYRGWNVGYIKGVPYGEEYKKIAIELQTYLNEKFDLKKIKKESKKWQT